MLNTQRQAQEAKFLFQLWVANYFNSALAAKFLKQNITVLDRLEFFDWHLDKKKVHNHSRSEHYIVPLLFKVS